MVLQVRFVNGFETLKGGTHVDYVTELITTHLMNLLNEHYEECNFNVDDVKRYLWVFLNVIIDNPTFDSQTKETLTTPPGRLGSKLELPKSFSKIGVCTSDDESANFG